jgi:spoIIIJ-associated protein
MTKKKTEDAVEVVENEIVDGAEGEATEADSVDVADGSAEAKESGDATDSGDSVKALEEEGDIAADYLEELLDIFDLDGDIDIDVRQGRAYLEISADDNSNLRLISEPETVEALQELTRLAVQVKTTSFSRLILDVGGSRQARVDELTKLVNKVVAKVKETGVASPLKPMSSYERKVVHDLVSEAGCISESEGEGKDRHIVVKPA